MAPDPGDPDQQDHVSQPLLWPVSTELKSGKQVQTNGRCSVLCSKVHTESLCCSWILYIFSLLFITFLMYIMYFASSILLTTAQVLAFLLKIVLYPNLLVPVHKEGRVLMLTFPISRIIVRQPRSVSVCVQSSTIELKLVAPLQHATPWFKAFLRWPLKRGEHPLAKIFCPIGPLNSLTACYQTKDEKSQRGIEEEERFHWNNLFKFPCLLYLSGLCVLWWTVWAAPMAQYVQRLSAGWSELCP